MIEPDVFLGLFCQKNPDGDHCPRMIPGPSPIGRGLIRLRDTPDHCHWMGLQITASRVIIGLGAGDYLYHIRAGLFTRQVTHMLLRHHNISSGQEAVAMATDALFSLCLPISVLYLLLGGDQGINCDLPVNHLTIIATWLLTNLDLELKSGIFPFVGQSVVKIDSSPPVRFYQKFERACKSLGLLAQKVC